MIVCLRNFYSPNGCRDGVRKEDWSGKPRAINESGLAKHYWLDCGKRISVISAIKNGK